MDIIPTQKELENIIDKHQNLIKTEAQNLRYELSIDSIFETQEAISKIDNENRLLQIGILGRVKAGKSSLLNALLFDGKSILPKAATPMTAALTIISYGDELSAEVEFFTQNDIENIKNEAQKYNEELKKLINEKYLQFEKKEIKKLEDKRKIKEDWNKVVLTPSTKDELKQKAERSAKREIKNNLTLVSSADQWQRIEQSGVNYQSLEQFKTIKASNIEELSNNLLEYVGADGKYMPFTKSVHIKIPQENLKGLQIVDTPGVNDPVQSRETRTRELLKYCDVVFIVSPSGQFMSSEDLDLMDRITSKEGIRELYVIASQIDLQLFGSIKQESNGDLQKALTIATNNLATHLNSTLIQLKNSNPEIGDAYDSLIEQSSQKVIYSSGICLTIKEQFDNRELWDEGIKTAWNNLTSHYPDYFSDNDRSLSIANLDLLANIATIKEIIENVKNKKDTILQKRKQEYIEVKIKSLKEFKNKLLAYIDNKIDEINSSNIDELKEEQKKLKKIKEKVSSIIDEEYYDIVQSLEININNKLNNKLENYFREAKSGINDAEKVESESYEVSDSSWYNPFSWGRTKTRYRDITTVRAGAVKSEIEDLIYNIENSIANESKNIMLNWKKELYKDLISVLRDNISDDDLNVTQIRKVLRNVLNRLKYPEIEYNNILPDSLQKYGTLKNYEAERFIEDAQEYVNSIRVRVRKDISNFIKELIEALKNIQMSKAIFGNYSELIKELEMQINNKEITIDSYNRLKKELSGVEV